MVGTWVDDEVRNAADVVVEIWEYKVTCFDKDSNSGGLFVDYVNMLLKLKQETSATHPGFKVKRTRTDILMTPTRRGNFSGQGINFQKREATNFGKTEIEVYEGEMGKEQNKTQTNILTRRKSFTNF